MAQNFSIPNARQIVSDLFVHKPAIYWTDFLISLTIAYSGAYLYFRAPLFSWQQLAFFLIAGFALFRVGSFIHEIVHLSGNTMRTFRIIWNIVAGIPMLMPSFFYENHNDHHSANHYGTGQDGEYLPLGSGSIQVVFQFYLQAMVLPLAVFLRFLLVTPISFLHPQWRRWVLEHASSFVINLRYRRRIPRDAPLFAVAVQEWCCCLRAWAVIVATCLEVVPWYQVFLLYGLGVMSLGLNYIRNLVAHHYRSDGQPGSYVEQLGDSVNIEGIPVLTELFFPLNLRYHALHHLFPTLPYHNLPRAHRRLISELPPGSLYHQTVYPGFFSVAGQRIGEAWAVAGAAGRGRAAQWYARRESLLRGWSDGDHRERATATSHTAAERQGGLDRPRGQTSSSGEATYGSSGHAQSSHARVER